MDKDDILDESDWNELRSLMLGITREHDEATAFTNENMGLHALMELMVLCYEHGRHKTLPPNWQDAYKVMIGRRDPLYKIHVKHRDLVRSQRAEFQHLEQLDVTELTGGPMQNFLRTQCATADVKKGKRKK